MIVKYLREYEKSVLAGMIKFPELRVGWSNILNEDCFLSQDHKFIFNTIIENKKMSEQELFTELIANGIRYNYDAELFIDYTECEGVFCNNTNSIDKVIQNKRYRDIENKWKKIDPFEPTEESIQGLFTDISRIPDGMDYMTAKDCFVAIARDMQNQDESTKPKLTGMKEYDEIIGGFTEGMHIISGRAGTGKSSLASQVLIEFSKHNPNKIAVFFSVEMAKKAIARRTTSHIAKIDNRKIKKFSFSNTEINHFVFEADRAVENCVFIPCTGICVSDAEQMLEKIKKDIGKDIGLVCFDYFQKMKPNEKKIWSENDAITKISSDLTEFSKNTPTIVVSNLNKPKEGRENSCPGVIDIKGGSIIEYDATSMMMLWKPNSEVSEICTRMAKNRDGEPGNDATWIFDGSTGSFYFQSWGSAGNNKQKNNKHEPF